MPNDHLLTGAWSGTWRNVGAGARTGTLSVELEQEGEHLSGKLEMNGQACVAEGIIDGRGLSVSSWIWWSVYDYDHGVPIHFVANDVYPNRISGHYVVMTSERECFDSGFFELTRPDEA